MAATCLNKVGVGRGQQKAGKGSGNKKKKLEEHPVTIKFNW